MKFCENRLIMAATTFIWEEEEGEGEGEEWALLSARARLVGGSNLQIAISPNRTIYAQKRPWHTMVRKQTHLWPKFGLERVGSSPGAPLVDHYPLTLLVRSSDAASAGEEAEEEGN